MHEIEKRQELAQIIDELELKQGAEIGVNTGGFSEHLLANSHLDVLHSIDSWTTDTSQTKSAFKKWAVRNGEVEKAYEETKNRLSKFGARSHIIRELSFDAVEHFEDGELDFLYLDGCHRFTGVALDLIKWWPKIRIGGVLAGHDYWKCYRCEVMEAVNGFVIEHKQIMHLTTQDKDWRGRNHYPPTFWLVKTQRTKSEWIAELPEMKKRLFANQKYLESIGVHIVLPYQYIDT